MTFLLVGWVIILVVLLTEGHGLAALGLLAFGLMGLGLVLIINKVIK